MTASVKPGAVSRRVTPEEALEQFIDAGNSASANHLCDFAARLFPYADDPEGLQRMIELIKAERKPGGRIIGVECGTYGTFYPRA